MVEGSRNSMWPVRAEARQGGENSRWWDASGWHCTVSGLVSIKLCSPAIPQICIYPDHCWTMGGRGWKSTNDKFENIGFNRKLLHCKQVH